VREAGELARRMFRTEMRTWTKGASSPVSEADIAVNDLILRRLRAFAPDDGLLSEESADDASRLAKSRVWIIDPIDGTRAFIAGRPDWVVSLALVEKGRPVAAAVYAPISDELFVAARGQGASVNGSSVHATTGITLNASRMAGPKSLIESLGLAPGTGEIHPRIGSLALRICRVADGRIDAAFASGNSRDWDLAGADLIVNEAGGKLTSLAGEPLVYNQPAVTHGVLTAAGRDRHAVIVARLQNHSEA
jgi:myo-inositol-1(or 4)-monophosphatase